MSQSIDDMNQDIIEESKMLAAVWFKDQCLNPYDSYYLYYKATGYMQVRIDREALDWNWTLASPERIRKGQPIEVIEAGLCEILRTLPILND